jgi:hypothetical protein
MDQAKKMNAKDKVLSVNVGWQLEARTGAQPAVQRTSLTNPPPLSFSVRLQMTPDNLLKHLRELEVLLHQPNVRHDRDRVEELLHESFTEFARSGRSYNRPGILEMLQQESTRGSIWSQDFTVAEIADGIALLTYKSAYIDENCEISGHALRSSLWQRTARGWQIRFHQGTATDAFEKRAT